MTYLILGTTLLIALLLVICNRVNMTLVSGLMLLIILGDFIFTGEDVYSFLGLFTTVSNSWVIILLACVCLLSASSAIVLSLFSAAGLLVLFCGDSLATVLGIESLTLLLLVMLFHNRGYFSAESSLKYLLVSVLGGALIVLGVIISFTLLGRFDLGITYNLSMLLLLVGVFLKLAGGGFHFWLMDVIEGAGSYASSIFMTLGKIPSFYLLGAVLSSVSGVANSAMALGAVVSLVISGLGTILSTKLSRILAYSAIGSTGWFLVLVLVQSNNLSLLYVAFTMTVVLLFIFLGALNDVYMIGLRGQRFANSLIIIFLVMCFSGFPPFIGFQVKWQLLMVVVTSSWLFPLIGLGILSTTFGYFRWLFLSVTYIRVYRSGMRTLYISVTVLIGIMCLSVAFFSLMLLINTGFGLVLLCVVSLRGYTFKAKFEPIVVCTRNGLEYELGFTLKGNPGRINLRLFGSRNRWVSLRYLSSGYLAKRLAELGTSNIHIDDNRFWVDVRINIDRVLDLERERFYGWEMKTRGPQLDHFNGRLTYKLDSVGSGMTGFSSEDLFRDDIAFNLDGIRHSGRIRIIGSIWGVAGILNDDSDSELDSE